MVAEIIKEAEQKMKSSIDHLLHELGKLRTGQASVALLDDLMVDYYMHQELLFHLIKKRYLKEDGDKFAPMLFQKKF